MKRFVGIGLALAVTLSILALDALARGTGDRQATQTQARDGSCDQVCDPACDGVCDSDCCQAYDRVRDQNRDGSCDRQCDGTCDQQCDGDGPPWEEEYPGFGLFWEWF